MSVAIIVLIQSARQPEVKLPFCIMDVTQNAPDEIIEKILRHVLIIPSDTFEAWRQPHDFAAGPRYDIWNTLLTSSRWYRVGLPLLYEAAILRTETQVASFARAILRCDGNGRLVLAPCVRRLRMEATYRFSFEKILDTCHDSIRVFYLGLDVFNEDDLFGLSMALGKVNPSRLILSAGPANRHEGPHFEPIRRWLGEAICEAAPAWTNLRRVDFRPNLVLIDMLVQYLASLPSVEAREHGLLSFYSLRLQLQ
ncbi:hypothetical protein C8Q80DRAFT_577750 [Daedaleopsis nitida]|nr:hypothetical protein C8Q80DRAFT_577750 [Daedaleopsis nitida]